MNHFNRVQHYNHHPLHRQKQKQKAVSVSPHRNRHHTPTPLLQPSSEHRFRLARNPHGVLFSRERLGIELGVDEFELSGLACRCCRVSRAERHFEAAGARRGLDADVARQALGVESFAERVGEGFSATAVASLAAVFDRDVHLLGGHFIER